jgi:hypothetical protein
MCTNTRIVITSLSIVGLLALLIVNIAYPELIGHPDKCNITTINSFMSLCYDNEPFSCIKLLAMLNVKLKDGTLYTSNINIMCNPPLVNCSDRYNNTIVPCLFVGNRYDIDKFNQNNILGTIFTILSIAILTVILITGICTTKKYQC